MTASYTRSAILNWYELSEAQQQQVQSTYSFDAPDCETFVEHKGEALPLSMFVRTTNNNFNHGVYGLSAFSCFTITLSKCNSEAVVAYKHF